MSDDRIKDPPRSRRRRLASVIRKVASFGTAALILVGLAGQAIRDRSVLTAVMMYVPLPLLGPVALLLDLHDRGRSLSRLRFGLTLLGIVAIGWSAIAMIGSGISSEPLAGDQEITLMHWNVQWGGGLFRSERTWRAQRKAILSSDPDLIVLSEAPPADWLQRLTYDLGPVGQFVGCFHDPRSPYWYRLVVCSRWPIHRDEQLRFPGGAGMSVTAEVRGCRLRLLVVDGQSSPFRSRLPFLRAVAEACREAATEGRPYDFVLGDFNTPSRSLGFDELTALDYRLASRSAHGWRATFPAMLPVYDIDHVWIGERLRLRSCTLFNGPWTDHLGHLARVLAGAQTGKAVRESKSGDESKPSTQSDSIDR
jgi:endonuclease/exonuclease/phosphatase family metal-dependent hydrolase